MRIKTPAMFTKKCRHESTIVVRSTGMERTVCEDCGHISFAFFTSDEFVVHGQTQDASHYEEHKKAS